MLSDTALVRGEKVRVGQLTSVEQGAKQVLALALHAEGYE